MTFIALDVGNTRLKWAMYANHSVDAPLVAQGAVFLENIDRLADEDWKPLPPATRMLGCIVAGDALRRRVDEQLELWDLMPSWVTVEAIDAQGHFLGGFILPGHGIMLRALESGTAGLRVPTGEVREFPTNTSDALTSGGTFAIAGAVERMLQHVRAHCKAEPLCYMTGGAGWKMAPSMSVQFELVDSLIFDGLRQLAASRFSAN